ncbi:MAG: helix-turn-helix domain-containing protein [Actinomycetota bacterium]
MLDGQTLRELRLEAGLTQSEVARRTGLPVTVVSAYERSCRQPSLAAANRIIDAIGFEAHFVRVLDPTSQAEKLMEVLALAEALPYRPRALSKARYS